MLRSALADFVAGLVAASPTLAPRSAEAAALMAALTEGWAERPAGGPRYVSYLSRDGTPFEPSVRISGEPTDLRFVLECQPETPSSLARDHLAAALALSESLEARGWADLTHSRRLVDLFRDTPPRTSAALWFGVALGPAGPPVLKHYFVIAEPAQWRAAFERFGLAGEGARSRRREPASAKAEFVSIDLVGHDPRLKLYVRHRDPRPRRHRPRPRRQPGLPARGRGAPPRGLLRWGAGGAQARPEFSTYHVSVDARAVTHGTLNVPLEPLHYRSPVPDDDDEVMARAARLCAALGLEVDPLYPHLLRLARADGVRYPHHRYAGLQRRAGKAEVTMYLSTLLQARRHGLWYGTLPLGPAQLL